VSEGQPPAGLAGPEVRRHTHPLTPVVNSVRALGAIIVALLVFGQEGLREAASAAGGMAGLVALLVGLLVAIGGVLGLSYLSWLRTEYFFDASGDFRLDSGILQRNERRVTLSRLQSVDVVRPLLGRVVGLAQLRIEVAGAGDSRVVLSYLTEAQAQALRAEIIARAAGVSPGAGEAPEVILATVPTGDLVVSLLLRSETVILLLVSVLVVGSIVLNEGAGGLLLLFFTGGLPLLSVFGQFMRFFGFTVADSPDGLRLRHGLASVQSQTVPPGRVQAIEVSEPLLWRRRGWVRVSLNVAGLQSGQDEGQIGQVLLPVAPHDVAAGIIGRVLPGVDLASLQLDPAPRRARKRAWLQWGNLGVAVDDRVLAVRRGFLTRHLAVIPHARTQSVEVSQGPWQRALGLASVQVDSTPGPVVVVGLHRDAAEARAIAEAQLLRAAGARASGPADRWMSRGPAGPVAEGPPAAPAGAPYPPAPSAEGPYPPGQHPVPGTYPPYPPAGQTPYPPGPYPQGPPPGHGSYSPTPYAHGPYPPGPPVGQGPYPQPSQGPHHQVPPAVTPYPPGPHPPDSPATEDPNAPAAEDPNAPAAQDADPPLLDPQAPPRPPEPEPDPPADPSDPAGPPPPVSPDAPR
jgi:putative membrane protein